MAKKNECKDWGALFMRIVLAAIFLYHGLPKSYQWTMAMDKFTGMGFPGFLGPVIGIVEVVAAVLLLLGIWNMWANYTLAAVIAVAIVGVQIPGAMAAGKLLTAGLERDLLILAGTLWLAWNGPGKYSLQK